MAKKGNTKKALLMSALSLLLCVSMLVGTTFAWFTDSVSSVNNKIVGGNLDVELYWSTDAENWDKVDENTNVFSDQLWEPGHAEIVYLKVVNEGTLALKYQLGVNIVSETAGINVANEVFELSDHIMFNVVEDQSVEFVTREDAIEAATTGAKKLNAGSSKTSILYAANDIPTDVEGAVSEEYVALVVYMPTTVGNEANYKTGTEAPEIDLGINLFATQFTHEDDSYGDDYDKNVLITVRNFAELKQAIYDINDGGFIKLEPGVYEFEHVLTLADKNVTIEGIGDVLLKNVSASSADHFFNVTEESNVVFRNLEFDGNSRGGKYGKNGIFVRYNSVVTLDNCTIYNTRGSSVCIDQVSDLDAVVGGTSYVNLINGSKVERISACAFPANGYTQADSYVKVTCDPTSTIDSFTKDSFVQKPENITLNGATAIVATADDLYAAIAAAEDGDTIFINSGVYTLRQLAVDNKSLTFIGIGNVILNGLQDNEHVFHLRNGASGTANEKMTVTIKNVTINGNSKCGIMVRNDLDLNVEDVKFTGTYKWAPLQVENSYDNESKFDGIVTVNAKNVVADKVTMAADDGRTTYFNYEGCDFGMIENQNLGGTVVINNAEVETPSFIYFVEDTIELQSILDSAKGEVTIVLTDDVAGNVIANQEEGTNLTIDGNGYKYDGQIEIYGHARSNGAETLTFKNVNFVTDQAEHDFITCNTTDSEKRYAHNVTVDNCTFTATGAGQYTAAGLRMRQCYNIVVKNSTFTNLHSAMWATGGDSITFDTVTITNCKNGISVGTCADVTIKNSIIVSIGDYGYGVRADANGAYKLEVANCTITADAPILLRKATGNFTLATTSSNNLTTTDKAEIVVTAADYEEGVDLTPATGKIIYIIDGLTQVDTPVTDATPAPYEGGLYDEGANVVSYKDIELKGNAYISIDNNASVAVENVKADVDGSVIVMEEYNPAIYVYGCEFKIDNGEYLIDASAIEGGVYQIFLVNVKVNGEYLTQESAAQYLKNVNWFQALQAENP